MNCDEIHDLITAYIQKEIAGEERISISQHLKTCKSCRESYLKELKLYYRLEYEEVMSPPEPVQAGFKNDILARTRYESTRQQKFRKKWLWYTAAAILIAGVMIGRYLAPLPSGSDKHPDEENTSITSLLEAEDWDQLQKVLQNRISLRRHAEEEISINVLLEKLNKLQNSIHPSPTIDISTGFSSSVQDSSVSSLKIQISIEDFITLLKQIQSQKKQITLKEVSSILTDI